MPGSKLQTFHLLLEIPKCFHCAQGVHLVCTSVSETLVPWMTTCKLCRENTMPGHTVKSAWQNCFFLIP